jgi:thiamine biosynthesis lipoprotein
MQTLEFRAMNTNAIIAAEGHDWATYGLRATRVFIEESERRFSRFLPESEVSHLNRSAGNWHSVSDDLMDMLEQSMYFYKETNGLFDPSILPDLKRMGYDKSMDEIRANGVSSANVSGRTKRPDFRQMSIDLAGRRVRLQSGMRIDLGGIAKGWIVERAVELLRTYAAVCAVSVGGDMVFEGYPLDGSDWRVNIEDPRDVTKTVAALHVGPGAVVTSSVVKRSWNQAGQVRHHLIDPRTGEPAATDWLSVTVIAPQITTAEVYAKALLIGGEGDASRLAAQRPEIAYFIVKSDGAVVGSQNSMEYINGYNYIYR